MKPRGDGGTADGMDAGAAGEPRRHRRFHPLPGSAYARRCIRSHPGDDLVTADILPKPAAMAAAVTDPGGGRRACGAVVMLAGAFAVVRGTVS